MMVNGLSIEPANDVEIRQRCEELSRLPEFADCLIAARQLFGRTAVSVNEALNRCWPAKLLSKDEREELRSFGQCRKLPS